MMQPPQDPSSQSLPPSSYPQSQVYPPSQEQHPAPPWGQQQQPYMPPQPPMYPPPQMQPPRRRSRRGLWIALGVIVLVLVVCGVGLSRLATLSSNTGTVVTTGNTPVSGSTPTTAPSSQHFKVGDQVKVGDTWLVTIESAKTSEGSQFNKPQKTGNVFLVFSVSMKNVSNQEQDVSSALQWTLQDTTGQKYTETIDTDAGATLDGKVEAGAPIKGSLAYEVPKATKAFTLAFEASLTEPGQTIWDITV